MFNLKFVYFIVFSTLAAWALFAYITTTQIINHNKQYSNIINITGKQRMLSQKTALTSMLYMKEKKPALKEYLISLLALMKKDHTEIITKHIHSKEAIDIYFKKKKLQKKVDTYQDKLSDFILKPDDTKLQNIIQLSYDLLPLLNEAVYMFEHESDLHTDKLLQKELFILFGTLLTLLLEAVFIIIPISKKLKSHEKELNELLLERTKSIQKLSVIDPLTQLYNRKKMERILTKEIDRAHRTNNTFSLSLVEIDNLNKMDTSQEKSEKSITKIAKILLSKYRSIDTVGRWSYKEFLIIKIDNDTTSTLAHTKEVHKLLNEDSSLQHTCSFSITHYTQNDTFTELLQRLKERDCTNCVEEF